MYKQITGIAMAVAVCLAGLGCGSDGGETTSAPLTKAQFTKQANAICTRAKKKNAGAVADWKMEHPAGGKDEEAILSELLQDIAAPAMQHEAEALQALQAPAKDKAMVDRLLRRLSKAANVLEEEGFRGLSPSRFSEFQREAAEYGLTECNGLLY